MAASAEPVISSAAWTSIAKWCRRVGVAGVVLLLLLIGYSLYLSREANRESGCFDAPVQNVPVSDSAPEGVRIVGIQPTDLALHHYLCVQVDNVVSDTKQNVLLANLAVARDAVKASATQGTTTPKEGTTASSAQADAKVADAVQTKAKADLDSAKAAFDDAQKPRTMVLYLNGKASPLTATARAKSAPQTLPFEISAPEDANSTDAAYWRSLLATPTKDGRIPLRIGVAEQGAPAPLINLDQVTDGASKQQPITFLLYTPYLKYAGLAAMVAIVLLFFGLAYDTTLLRSGSAKDSAYSLSLVQMAIWFILTITGFAYIWLVTGQFQNVFTSGLFVLIGISGATATAAFAIDRAQTIPTSNGFFYDIVGAWQGGEVQLQRLQIIAWTVILALIFCWNVLAELRLTSFDTNLLVLAGIANGVYVSLKPQERKDAA